MNNYAIKHEPNTSVGATVLIVAGLIGSLMLPLDVGQSLQLMPFIGHPAVRIEESSRTFGQYMNLFTGEYETRRLGFEEKVTMFFAELLGMQEPLGKEFEEVLYDNLWDLLIHT